MLFAEFGPWRVFVSTDARRLKGRDDSAPARWDDVSPTLDGFALLAVDLRGLSRRIYIGAEQSSDVVADVRRIRDSIKDEFHVTDVVVRRLGDGEAAVLEVDFSSMVVTARQTAPIGAFLRAAGDVLAHRRPTDYSSLITGLNSQLE